MPSLASLSCQRQASKCSRHHHVQVEQPIVGDLARSAPAHSPGNYDSNTPHQLVRSTWSFFSRLTHLSSDWHGGASEAWRRRTAKLSETTYTEIQVEQPYRENLLDAHLRKAQVIAVPITHTRKFDLPGLSVFFGGENNAEAGRAFLHFICIVAQPTHVRCTQPKITSEI